MSPAVLPAFKVQVLRLRGDISLEDMEKVNHVLSGYTRAGMVNVLLNLEHVSHVELVGMPLLNARAVRLREYGGDLKLVGASPYLRHLFTLAGVGQAFDFCADEDAAAKRFGATVNV